MPRASRTRRAGPAARAPAMLSGANEVAVEAFLDGRIAWPGIAEVVDEVLQQGTGNVPTRSPTFSKQTGSRARQARDAVERRSAA